MKEREKKREKRREKKIEIEFWIDSAHQVLQIKMNVCCDNNKQFQQFNNNNSSRSSRNTNINFGG